MFSSRSFVVSGLMFRSLIHFEFLKRKLKKKSYSRRTQDLQFDLHNIGISIVSKQILVHSACIKYIFTVKNFKHCSMQTNLSFINFHHSQHYWYTLIKYIWLKNYIIVVVFAIHWHESAMAVHEFPILNLPPTYLPILSLWVVPVHQPWAPCLMHRTWTGTSHHFQAFIPPSPSPTESNSLFFTSVSLLLSRI